MAAPVVVLIFETILSVVSLLRAVGINIVLSNI